MPDSSLSGEESENVHMKCLEELLLVYERPCWCYQSLLCNTKLPQMHCPSADLLLACLSLFLPVLPKMGFEGQRHCVCCNLPVHMLSDFQESVSAAITRDHLFGLHLVDQWLLLFTSSFPPEMVFWGMRGYLPSFYQLDLENIKEFFFTLKVSGICHFRKNTSQLSSQACIIS